MHKALALVPKDKFRENREQSTPNAVVVLRGNAQMGLAANANQERGNDGEYTRCSKEGDQCLCCPARPCPTSSSLPWTSTAAMDAESVKDTAAAPTPTAPSQLRPHDTWGSPLGRER